MYIPIIKHERKKQVNIIDFYASQINKKTFERMANYYDVSTYDIDIKKLIKETKYKYDQEAATLSSRRIGEAEKQNEYLDLARNCIAQTFRIHLLRNAQFEHLLVTYNDDLKETPTALLTDKSTHFPEKDVPLLEKNVKALKEWCEFIQENEAELLSNIEGLEKRGELLSEILINAEELKDTLEPLLRTDTLTKFNFDRATNSFNKMIDSCLALRAQLKQSEPFFGASSKDFQKYLLEREHALSVPLPSEPNPQHTPSTPPKTPQSSGMTASTIASKLGSEKKTPHPPLGPKHGVKPTEEKPHPLTGSKSGVEPSKKKPPPPPRGIPHPPLEPPTEKTHYKPHPPTTPKPKPRLGG